MILTFKNIGYKGCIYVLPPTLRKYLQNYLFPCFKHTLVVRQQKKTKLKPHTPTSAIPFVVVSFHSNSFSIITITLKQEIYYSPFVFTASDTRLIDKYGL